MSSHALYVLGLVSWLPLGITNVDVVQPRSSTKDATYLEVNYQDVEATAAALESANIDTVICAISMLSEESSQTQHKLIDASSRSNATRRFVVSSFDIYFQEEYAFHYSRQT